MKVVLIQNMSLSPYDPFYVWVWQSLSDPISYQLLQNDSNQQGQPLSL